MTAIGLFPFYDRPVVEKVRTLTVAASPHMLVMVDGTTPDGVKPTTGAAVSGVVGVINDPQGDPNNSNAFPIGGTVNVCEVGTVPILFCASESVVRGNPVIAGATAGCAKMYAAEGACDIIGFAEETKTIGASPDLASVRLSLHRKFV